MRDVYTTAVLELLSAGTPVAEVLQGLSRTMTERGHQKLYAPVLKAVLRILSAQDGRTGVRVTVAREADRARLHSEITAALKRLGVTDEPDITIDDSIIGGHIVDAHARRIDASYKSKLVELYRAITN